MATLAKVNAVAATNVAKVSGAAKANVAKVSGADTPAAYTYATLDPTTLGSNAPTLSNGNLSYYRAASGGGYCNAYSTIPLSGKTYIEITCGAANTGSDGGEVGVRDDRDNTLGLNSPSSGWGCETRAGQKSNNGTTVAYGSALVAGDILMLACDPTAGKVWWGKNGTWFASGDPAAGTNPAYTGLPSTMYFGIGGWTGTAEYTANFGASAFAYTAPTGFVGLRA
jgi:hypothetical protein